MTLLPPDPKSPPSPPILTWIIILVAGIIIGLLIGWFVDIGGVDIHKGDPTFSSYNTATGVITIDTANPNRHYWVTSSMSGSANKGVSITSTPVMPYDVHHYCTPEAVKCWDLIGASNYQLTPRYETTSCTPGAPYPTNLMNTPGSPYTLETKTGAIRLIHDGVTHDCPIDVYTFTDGSGNTSCITIVMMDM